ncbi:MAG: UDP-N-acetylglucosamine 1-carboxyvinyltransferase [Abditibacteriales bacterium]|nr:UDP-N-acetylglucosamine 1-carboxyvinyltransferase [Abditibacteriales bacterium]MDW8364780.1 UDP-N-acetylglucosamine 1-carboxyvinyltransferase [Abditibacteriales bacterium]
MEKIYVTGGPPLRGSVELSGSKNSSLPALAGTLLASHGECILHNIPPLSDIYNMLDVLRELGAKVSFSNGTVVVNAQTLRTHVAPYKLVRKMRASYYVAGPLLARLGRMKVALPGGCAIGTRPVDFHNEAFRAMGATLVVEHGYTIARCDRLVGTSIYLDPRWCSVGATVNVMMAASLARGVTTIENAARDPEICDFADFLNKMGARIHGAGTATMTIEGVTALHGCEHTVIPDRIEAGTFLLAGAVTGGDVTVHPISPGDLTMFLNKLQEAGAEIKCLKDAIRVRCPRRPKAVDVITLPFPGFPTDLHPAFVVLQCLAEGRSLMEETIYDARFKYTDELTKMGADITVVDNHHAIIRGVERLTGASVESTDIRAGAALVLAGLAAQGETEVGGVQYIDRGYERIEEKLQQLGAQVVRLCDQPQPLRMVS